MLLAEDPLDLLLDRLRTLPAADRRGVLARLSPAERKRVEAALRAPPAEPVAVHAPDIVERILAPDGDRAMTAAGRAALARVAGPAMPVRATAPRPSLFERLAAMLRGR